MSCQNRQREVSCRTDIHKRSVIRRLARRMEQCSASEWGNPAISACALSPFALNYTQATKPSEKKGRVAPFFPVSSFVAYLSLSSHRCHFRPAPPSPLLLSPQPLCQRPALLLVTTQISPRHSNISVPHLFSGKWLIYAVFFSCHSCFSWLSCICLSNYFLIQADPLLVQSRHLLTRSPSPHWERAAMR